MKEKKMISYIWLSIVPLTKYINSGQIIMNILLKEQSK